MSQPGRSANLLLRAEWPTGSSWPERAAFKGYYQRAIDCYRDALYYLTRDRSDFAGEAAADRITREIELLRVRLDSE